MSGFLVACEPEQSRLGVKSTNGEVEILYACSDVESIGLAIVSGRDEHFKYLWRIVADGTRSAERELPTRVTVGSVPDGFIEELAYRGTINDLSGKSLAVTVVAEGVLDVQEFDIDDLPNDRYVSASTTKSAEKLLRDAKC